MATHQSAHQHDPCGLEIFTDRLKEAQAVRIGLVRVVESNQDRFIRCSAMQKGTHRQKQPVPPRRVAAAGRLHFEEPDTKRFPCLDLAYAALAGSEAAPAVLNAANEVAVAAFLEGGLAFSAVAETNRAVLEAHLAEARGTRVRDLEDVRAADAWARARALERIQ